MFCYIRFFFSWLCHGNEGKSIMNFAILNGFSIFLRAWIFANIARNVLYMEYFVNSKMHSVFLANLVLPLKMILCG